jgi:hypothetical protein
LGTNEYLVVYQAIEGNNFDDLRWGTASASPITISFWVRASVTGTYSVALRNANGGYNRSYIASYTINAIDTWEYKTVTIAGDQSGTWAAGNGAAVQIAWDLGSGSGLSTTAGTWTAGSYLRGTSQTNWISNAGATFFITGVQVEKGSTASSFEYRPYTTELQLCQRYFEKSWHPNTAVGTADYYGVVTSTIPGSTGQYTGTVNMSVSKRSTSPTVTFYNPSSGASGTSRGSNGSNYTTTVYWYTAGTTFSFNISSFPAGSNFTFHWTCSDEL